MNRPFAILGTLLFAVLLAIVTFGQALSLGLNHDEHQFIAPAVLLAREGALPYRDVPLFHQPYLVCLDALVLQFSDSPLLAARLVSGSAACLTGFLLFTCAWLGGKNLTRPMRFTAAVSLTLLWLTSTLFHVASGRSWNHDLPSLFAIAALALLVFSEKTTLWHWLAAGLLGGLAAGTRLTLAPFAGLLPLAALLWPTTSLRLRFAHFAAAVVGLAFALAPSLWFYAQSPHGYLFGNFQFPRLPLLEADNSRILKTTTPWRKIRFFFKEVFRENVLLLIPAVVALFFLVKKRHTPLVPLLLLVAALAAGAFAPSRYEMQHFYIVAPLAAFVVACSLPFFPRRAVYGLALLAAIGLLIGQTIQTGHAFFRSHEWDVSSVHREGLALRAKVPSGKILTLAPIVPLEGGLSIYPPLATGPFGWKFAYLVPAARRQTLGLLAADDLPATLQNDPPAAILTGVESKDLEKPLIAFAKAAGYLPSPFGDKATLWLPAHF